MTDGYTRLCMLFGGYGLLACLAISCWAAVELARELAYHGRVMVTYVQYVDLTEASFETTIRADPVRVSAGVVAIAGSCFIAVIVIRWMAEAAGKLHRSKSSSR